MCPSLFLTCGCCFTLLLLAELLGAPWCSAAPWDEQLGSQTALNFASCLFPTVLLPSLHQGRMEEMNETPQGMLPSPKKLGPRPMPQLPGRPGLAQPLGLVPLMIDTRVAPAQVDTAAKRRGEKTQILPPSIRKALECVTIVCRSPPPTSPACPLSGPCPKAQTAPSPPAAELSLPHPPAPPNTTASLHTPHPPKA